MSSRGCPDTGDIDQGQGCWNDRRMQQATALMQWIRSLKAANLLVISELNAYGEGDAVRKLMDSSVVNLNLPLQIRYSYVYNSQSGDLDHALASLSLAKNVNADSIELCDLIRR